jgi:hypothetical protein
MDFIFSLVQRHDQLIDIDGVSLDQVSNRAPVRLSADQAGQSKLDKHLCQYGVLGQNILDQRIRCDLHNELYQHLLGNQGWEHGLLTQDAQIPIIHGGHRKIEHVCLQGEQSMKLKKPKPLTYTQAIRFHGHNGPFLALGYRLGQHVNTLMKPKGIMDYLVTVYVRREKPYTCVIDGLQCVTFATLGKGNILVRNTHATGVRVKIVSGSRTLIFTSTSRAMTMCLGPKDLERAAAAVIRARFVSLWNRVQ